MKRRKSRTSKRNRTPASSNTQWLFQTLKHLSCSSVPLFLLLRTCSDKCSAPRLKEALNLHEVATALHQEYPRCAASSRATPRSASWLFKRTATVPKIAHTLRRPKQDILSGAHLLLGRLLVAGLLLAVVVRLQRCMLQFQSWETKQLRTVVLKPTPCGRASNNDFARESTNSTLQVLTC